MINTTGDWLALTREMSSIATVSAIKNTSPSSEAASRFHDRARNAAVGILGVLGEVRGGVEAHECGEAHDHGEHQPAALCKVVRIVLGDTARDEVTD
jgi:hypothetical protein